MRSDRPTEFKVPAGTVQAIKFWSFVVDVDTVTGETLAQFHTPDTGPLAVETFVALTSPPKVAEPVVLVVGGTEESPASPVSAKIYPVGV